MIKRSCFIAILFLLKGCAGNPAQEPIDEENNETTVDSEIIEDINQFEEAIYPNGICISLNCLNNEEKTNENQKLVFFNNDKIIVYKGNINDDNMPHGIGKMFFEDKESIEGVFINGNVVEGLFFYIKDNEYYTLDFESENINPLFIKDYDFIQQVKLTNKTKSWQFEGLIENLRPVAGKIIADNIIIDGDFNYLNFKGSIKSPNKEITWDYDTGEFSYTIEENQQRTYYGGILHNNTLTGEQKIFINNEEIYENEGEWTINFEINKLPDFSFPDLIRNGVFDIKSQGLIETGLFENNKREGYFYTEEDEDVVNLSYFKDGKKLYEINYEEKKESCKSRFNINTFNLWDIVSCNEEYNKFTIIDNSHISSHIEVKTNNENSIEKIIIKKSDKKMIFHNPNYETLGEEKNYLLEGVAELYQWDTKGYILIHDKIETNINNI